MYVITCRNVSNLLVQSVITTNSEPELDNMQ